MAKPLYERIGGFKSVRKIVSDFYDRVLEDDDLSPHFAKVDMANLIDHQTKFWAMLLGGPASYTNDQLRGIHKGMSITENDFELVCELVVETLEDHDVEKDDIDHVRSQLLATRDSIIHVE